MNNITNKFSLTDFLAYQFPGILFSIPLSLISYLILHKFNYPYIEKIASLVTAYSSQSVSIFIVITYLLGNFSPSLILIMEEKLRSLCLREKDKEKYSRLEGKVEDILTGIYPTFTLEDFSKKQLYLGRSLIREHTPSCSL